MAGNNVLAKAIKVIKYYIEVIYCFTESLGALLFPFSEQTPKNHQKTIGRPLQLVDKYSKVSIVQKRRDLLNRYRKYSSKLCLVKGLSNMNSYSVAMLRGS